VHLSVSVPGYSLKSMTYGSVDLFRENMKVAMTDTAELRVVLETTSTTMTTIGGVVGGIPGGIVTNSGGGTIGLPPPPPPPPPPGPASAAANVNRVTAEVAQSNLLTRVEAVYPPAARTARVQGIVVLQFQISIEGRVQNASVVSSIPLLDTAALDAVRQWTYKPFVLNGQTIPVITTATVNFTLQ